MSPRVLIALVLLASVACQPNRPSATSTAAPPSSPTGAAAAPPTTAPTTAPSTRQPAGGPGVPLPTAAATPGACGYGSTKRLAELQDRTIKEASGLVASHRTPGLYWTHNDSGNDPLLFAFDQNGRKLGTFRVDGAENDDWESLQLGPGRDGGPALYIGDAGDNNKVRGESVIYRVPEPEVSLNTDKPLSARTAPAEAFRFTYPNGSHDVETMLVHPTTGETLLVTKDYRGRASVFRVPLEAGRRTTAEAVADLDLRHLGPVGSAVTDGAVAPDARRVVLRTYVAALEYDVPEGGALAQIWQQQPRTYPLDDGPQGEGITYRADGKALLTTGESTPAVLYQAEWRC